MSLIGCLRPIWLSNKKGMIGSDGLHFHAVPCGHCAVCRKERSKAWAIRLMMEFCTWNSGVFITLTYDDEHIPKVEQPVVEGVFMKSETLVKRDFQLFIKRLRKVSGRKLKYYACGEYGSHTFRPHYHAILYGFDICDTELIKSCWPYGFIEVGDVTMQSCNYVAGYIQKKLYGDVAAEVYGERLPPFSLMSKGLGRAYLEKHWKEMMQRGFIRYRDKIIPIPRYYWRLMLEDKVDGVSPEYAEVQKALRKKVFLEEREKSFRIRGVPEKQRVTYEDTLRELKEKRIAQVEGIVQSRSKI